MRLKTPSTKQLLIVLACISAISLLCLSCLNSGAFKMRSASNDVLSQKKTDKNKIQITVLVKYAFSINKFEEIVEEKFPDIDIVQVGNYTSDRGLVEYDRRMKHDDLTDIIMTWPLDIGRDHWADRLIDLSGMQFTANYHNYMLNRISDNGKLYYVPGPAQVRGIVYNKTLFKENNWPIPTNFDEFVALCQKIEASGYRSLQLGFANSEVLDTAFVGFSYGNGFNKPQDSKWLNDYNRGRGTIAQQFNQAFDTFQALAKAGVLKKEDLTLSYADREKMLFNRQCAMIEDSVLIAKMGNQYNGCTDEFALMPFFNPGSGSWARLYMVCYIGLNKHLLESQNKAKYAAVKKIMDYISTPEGQQALTADNGAMYSSVNMVPPPDTPEIELLLPDLHADRVAIFPELKNAQAALRQGLASLLRGTMSKEDVVKLVDNANNSPLFKSREIVLGEATENFTLIDTGNWVTDVMRNKTGADFALFMDNGKDGRFNGKGLSGKIYHGPQTEEDIIRIFPDLKSGDTGLLQKITISGADLLSTLEYSLPVNNNQFGWFYYFSGLKMEFDPAEKPGSRIHKISDADGKPIDRDKLYTVAVMEFIVPKHYIRAAEDYNISIKSLLIESLRQAGTITPSKDKRFVIVK